MPPPLPHQSSNLDAKKDQSSNMMPSDHDLSKKREENSQVKTPSSSPQVTIKMRSAFEDITNASQSQLVQSENEDCTEFVKDSSKRLKRKVHVPVFAKNNEKKIKRFKVELVPAVDSTASVPNMDISTKSKTITTKKASRFKQALVLTEETSLKETTLMRKAVKRCTNHEEMSELEKPLTLLEEAEKDDELNIEPVTFGKKYKPEEEAITEESLFLKKKMYIHQKKQSCQEELLASKDRNVEKSSSYLELIDLDISTTEKKMSGNNSLIQEPLSFKKSTTKKDSSYKMPSVLQERHTTQAEVSTWRKPLTLKKPPTENESHFQVGSAFKKRRVMEEIPYTRKSLPLQKQQHSTKEKRFCNKPVVAESVTYKEETSLTKELLSFEKSEEVPSDCPLALEEKYTTQLKVSTLKKPIEHNIPTEEEPFYQMSSAFKKWCVLEQTANTMNLLLLQKQQHTIKGKMVGDRSQVIHPVKYKDESFIKESLSFKKSTTEEDFPFKGTSLFQKKHPTQVEAYTLKKPLDPQKPPPTEEESRFQVASALAFEKRHITGETIPTKKPLDLQKQKHTTQKTVSIHLNNPPVLQTTISGKESLTKEQLSFKKENASLQKRSCTTQTTPFWPEQSEWQKIIDDDTCFFTTESVSSSKEPTTTDGFLRELSSLEEKHTTEQEVTSKPVASQEKTSSEEEYNKEPVALKEGPTNDKEFFSPELFSPYSSASEDESVLQKHLDLQEKNYTEKEPFKLLASQEDSTSEEETILNKIFRKEDSPEEGTSQERPVAQEQLFLLNKELAMCENTSSDDDEPFIKQPLATQVHSNIKKKAFKKPLDIQEKPSIKKMAVHKKPLILKRNYIKDSDLKEHTFDADANFKNYLSSQETASTGKEAISQEPLVLPEKLRIDAVALLKDLLAMLEKPRIAKKFILKDPNTKSEATLKKCLILKGNTSSKLETLLKELLPLLEKPSTEKEFTSNEPLVVQKPSTKTEAILKEPLALQEKPHIQKEARLKESLAFHDKPRIRKDSILKNPLAFQKKPNIEASFKETLTLNKTHTTMKEFSFEYPLTLKENPTQDGNIFLKTFNAQVENSQYVCRNALGSSTDKTRVVDNSCVVNMCTTTIKSSLCDPGSKCHNSLLSRAQNEILEHVNTVENTEIEDSESLFNSVYAKEIFSYLREREEKFILQKYMHRQPELTSEMRAILVDWLVEVQISFEMSHETLYLAVKLVDRYLMKVFCRKDSLQLLGSTALMIAAKFEEPYPPRLYDFLYICEDLYKKHEMLAMEVSILKALNFDINIPVAYHFLRRYAWCVHTSMRTLTLSRFICEMTLQKYEYIQEKPSKLAAASFLLALYMRNFKHLAPSLEKCSGYLIAELHPIVMQLNMLLTSHHYEYLKTVYHKYSQEAFFAVSKIPPLDMSNMEKILR